MIEGIYNGCSILLEVLIQFLFFNKLAGKKAALLQIVCFVVFGCIVAGLSVSAVLKAFFFLLALIAGGVVLLRMDYKCATLYGVVTTEVMQLCFGIVNSTSAVLAPYLYPLAPVVLGRVFMIGGTAGALGLSCLCYTAICKCLKRESEDGKQYVLTMLAPLLLVLMASGYINYMFYGNVVTIDTKSDFLGTGFILLVQTAGIISVFCVMYAYQKLTAWFSLDMRLAMLKQKAYVQEQYIMQAQSHYDSTKALRHDIRNHLLVVGGLLKKGNVEKAKAYIGKLDEAAAYMAFPFRTGSPVLDALLENKFALAKRKGIFLEGFLKLPSACFAAEMDLVIILANALDNAIDASEKMPSGAERVISFSSRIQGEFLWIGIENRIYHDRHTCCFQQGTGLSNIKEAAGRCGGKINIEITDCLFCLNVMLPISQQPACISQQVH